MGLLLLGVQFFIEELHRIRGSLVRYVSVDVDGDAYLGMPEYSAHDVNRNSWLQHFVSETGLQDSPIDSCDGPAAARNLSHRLPHSRGTLSNCRISAPVDRR